MDGVADGHYPHFMARPRRELRDTTPEEQLQAGVDALKARLEEIVSRPDLSPRDAEEAAEAALAIADLIRSRDRALRVLEGSVDEPPPRPRETLEGLPLREAAREVLRREGRPIRTRELGELIYEAGWKNPRGAPDRTRIAHQLSARLGPDPDFVRWLPGMWALREQGFVGLPKDRPKPLFGLFRSPPGSPPAADMDEELATIMDDDRHAWGS